MQIILTFEFVVINVFIIMMSNGGKCCSTGITQNKTETCCLNYYNDGNICKECLPGYFGINCSKKCNPPSYGLRCSERCRNCSLCHHIFGCIPTQEMTEGPADINVPGNIDKTTAPIINTRKIVIIICGSLISSILVSFISREFFKYRRLPA